MKKQTEKEIKAFLYNVQQIRKRNRISKKRMAEILGIGRGSLTKIEKGILPPRLSVEVVFRIQQYFGISAAEQFR